MYHVWNTGDDVHVANRHVAWALKVSLHKSGVWRHAFTEKYAADADSFVKAGADRLLTKWGRPEEMTPGLTKAFTIIVPASEVTVPVGEDDRDQQIAWWPPGAHGTATHFTVLFAASDPEQPGWVGQDTMGTDLVLRAELPRGETLWVVEHIEPMSQQQTERLADYKALFRSLLETEAPSQPIDPKDPSARNLFEIGFDDGSAGYVETAFA